MQEDKFSIFIPIEIEKSNKTGEERYDNMRFKGIASNPNLGDDKQGQWLDPSGFSLKQFLEEGSINWHHRWKDKPTAIIGEPTAARITKANELYIEGKLYKDSTLAREVYDTAEIMEKNSDTRRMGFSIEGIPLLKDPENENRILKAKITQVAITPSPVCPGTRMEIMKGGFEDLQFDNQQDSEFLVDIIDNGIRYTVDKNLNIQKSDYGTPGAAFTQDEETAEAKQRVTAKESLDTGKKKKKKEDDKDEYCYMSKAEIIYDLISKYDLDTESCKKVYELSSIIQKKLCES